MTIQGRKGKAAEQTVLAAPSAKKQRRMTGQKDGILGAGTWGGLNRRVRVVGVDVSTHMETRDENWWQEFKKPSGVK